MLILILFFFQLIFIYCLPLNITSGDGAELVTAIALNGIAHPSGYPLYSFLAKLFTFIPFGTIAFRISLFSSICATISLFIVYNIVYIFTKNKISSIFSMVSLFLSYSFFYQSLFQKFYTLNLLIILSLFFIGLKCINNGYKKEYQYIIFFILGLSFSCHHTALLMIIPFSFVAFIYFREFYKNILKSILLFLLGSIINISIYIKLSKLEYTLYPMSPTLKNFIFNYIFRGIYKKESSIHLIKDLFHSFKSFLYVFNNDLKILQVNFPLYFTYLLFIVGLVYLYKLNKRIFYFFILSFITYSFLLTKLTFSMHYPTVFDYYVYANQYFLPMLALFSIVCGYGLFFLMNLVKTVNYRMIYYLISILPIFYLIILPIRFKDNLWSRNLAVYQSRVDKLFSKPINSIYITKGDNPVFQTVYLKKVANFRNDICQIMNISLNKNYFINCFKNGKIRNEYFSFNLENFLLNNYNLKFPTIFTTENMKNKLNYFWVLKNISDFLLIPKADTDIDNIDLFYTQNSCSSIIDNFYFNIEKNIKINQEFSDKIMMIQNIFKRFYNFYPCLEHSTDDYFTYGNCYATYVRNRFISDIIKEKVIKYNSALMPYILVDDKLKGEFNKVIINEIK